MKMQFTKYCLLLISLIIFKFSYAQTDMLFWFVAPEVNDWHGSAWPYSDDSYGHPTHFRFSNTESFEVTVTISQPANPSFSPINVTLPANSTQSIQFHRTTFDNITVFDLDDIENELNNYALTAPNPGNVSDRGLKIEATGRITAYYEITAKWNMEIMSLKGQNALGTEFFVPFETVYDTDTRYDLVYSAIDIVATQPNTQVQITPTQDMLLILGSQTPWPAGSTYTITLQEGETFSAVPYDTDGDNDNTPWDISRRRTRKLAGTMVTSNKPIAVNTKDDLVSASGVDIVADQLVPTNMLGNDYIVMQNVNLTNINEYAYVLATDDGTEIFVNGASQGTIDQGEQMTVLIDGNKTITSPDSAFYVFHVSGVDYGAGGAQQGGAVLPNVTECTGSYSVSFVRSSNDNFYMNVMVRDGGQDGFEINGDPNLLVSTDFTGPITTPSGDWYIASKWFNTGDIPINTVQTITNTNDKLFHLGILNGYTDCFYGYFSDYNSINVVGNVGTTINKDYFACYGESVELVAYGANSYYWYANLSPDFLNGQEYDQRPVINPTGDRKYTVVGYGDCNMKDSTEINVYVADPIIADYALTMPEWPPCSPYEIMIENFSEDDWPVWRYQWLYGDGVGDTTYVGVDTLYHTYVNTSDTMQVRKLTLVTENNFYCKDTLETEVIVYPEIHAAFTPDAMIGCNPLTVNFEDNSTGHLDKYRWVFGDGSILTTEGDESYTYEHTDINNTIDYEMELRLTSPFLCRDTARTTIRVYPHLEGEFTIDVDEGCSPLEVTITNVSEGEDHIILDYGDGSGTLDQASFISSTHTYINDGDSVAHFPIELFVENDEGCEKYWYDTITVYPSVQAAFTVDNDNICNSAPVRFFNNSSYGTHRASKFMWTFGDGSNSDTTSNDFYKTYTNTTDNDQTRNVQLIAKSVYGCADTVNRDIYVYRALADFVVDKSEGCSPLPVQITNTSAGSNIGSWLWDYDDGATDPNENPGIHSYTYNNSSGVVNNRDLRLTVTHATQAWCSTYKEITIDVFSEIDVTYIPIDPTQCDSTDVNFDATINPMIANTDFEWDFGDGTSSSIEDPTHTYRNTANAGQLTYNVQVDVETPNGCTDLATGTVNINPRVRAFFTIDESEGCSPHTITVTPTSYVGIDEYHWDFDGDGTVDANEATAAQQTFTFPRNTSGADTTYNVTLEVFDPSGTCSDTYVIPVTVYSETKANFDNQNYIDCNSFSITFDNLSFNSNTWHWDFGDGTSSSAFEPTKLFTNTGSTDSIYHVTLEVTSNRGCTHDTSTQITVYPYVEAAFAIDVSNGCSPLTVNITNNSSGSEFYWFWDDADLTLANADSNSSNPGSHTYTHTTGGPRTDSLTLIVGNGQGCYDTLKRAITINSSLDANFTISQPNACNPSDVTFTNTTLYSNNYIWDFGDGSSVETTSNPVSKTFDNNTPNDQDFRVTLTAESAEGCSDTISQLVTVYSMVEADFSVDISEGCSPLEVTFSNNSTGTEFYWFWDDDDLTLAAQDSLISDATFTRTFTYSGGGNQLDSITLIVGNGNGCYDTLKRAINVYSSIDAQFTFSQPDSCNQSDVEFTNTSVGGGTYTLNWNFGDGTSQATTSNTINKTFRNYLTDDKDFVVTMAAESENGCTDQVSHTVRVFSRLQAGISVPNSQACPPFNTTIVNTSIGNNLNQYDWYVDDTLRHSSTGLDDFTYEYANTDTTIRNYTVRMVATNPHGCWDDTTATITVYEYVDAQFAPDVAAGCSPHTVQFNNNSFANANTNYNWNFGDATSSNEKEPDHLFVNSSRTTPRDFTVLLTVTSENFCTDTISHVITAYNQPLAKLNISETSSCPPLDVTMNNFDSKGYDSFEWRFGDAANTTDNVNNITSFSYPNINIDNIENYTLKLYVETNQGCWHMDSTVLNVFPRVIADFTVDDADGCSPHVTEVQNASSSPATQFYWDFNDGSYSNKDTVIHSFVNDSYYDRIYQVKLTATSDYNCWDTITKPITAYAQPKALFNPTPTAQKFPESTVWMNSASNNQPWDYTWEFDDMDNTTSTNSNVQFFEYPHWGQKDIILTLESQTSDCWDSDTNTVIIYPPDVNADFIADVYSGCEPLTVNFTASASVYNEVYDYEWDYGDGTGETGANVTHTFDTAGIYNIKLTALSNEPGGGQDFTYEQIRVYSNPEAKFEISPKEVRLDPSTLEARVKFYNGSICNDTAGCSYIWYFGDGESAISRESSYTYDYTPDPEDDFDDLGDGTRGIKYDVCLVATSLSGGCTDSTCIENGVTIRGSGEIEFPNAFTPDGHGPAENETFRPKYRGVVEYELLIYNRWGELIFQTKDKDEGWKGTINDEPAKPDVYVWKAIGTFSDGRAFEIAGDVTLIR